MYQARNYLPYAVGIFRWGVFFLLKVVPALFYRPYTSKTLERDVERHKLLMENGAYLCLRSGTICGFCGGVLGLGLSNLIIWLLDKDVYARKGITLNLKESFFNGFAPSFAIVFIFTILIERLNIYARRKFMASIRGNRGSSSLAAVEVESGSSDPSEADQDCLVDPNSFTPADVTIVVPVYEPPPAFSANMISLLANNPAKILIVADVTCVSKIQAIVDALDCDNSHLVEVIPEPLPGKRAALSTGLKEVRTRLTCFVDDDCQWCCETYLTDLIKPFDNRTIGGVGSKQIMRPSEDPPTEAGGEPIFRRANIYEVMADFRLAVRYIDLMATTTVDRGASCISGRTMCFLTDAIGEEEFHHKFMHESLFGVHLLSGDDKFITRYVIKKGYKTYHQLQEGCVLTTTFERTRKKHMSQLIRWSRNTWRSDMTALCIERKIWLHNPFTAFLLFDKLFTPFFLMYGLIIIPVYSILRMDWFIVGAWLVWLLFSRAVKLCYHFSRRPDHIIYLPIWICYQYLLGAVRLYALTTMLRTHWGNRAVSVVGNKVVRTGEMAANLSESDNDDSRQTDGDYESRARAREADHENFASSSTQVTNDNEKKKTSKCK